MRTDYPVVITEGLATRERQVRGGPTAVRVQALRLRKSGSATSLAGCATLVGHSPRQVARWWATCRQGGLEALLREQPRPGKVSRLTAEARAGLEAAMAQGQITTLADAQHSLAAQHGVVYGSRNGVWQQLRKHRINLKTGRRRHRNADPVAPDAFSAGLRGDGGGGWGRAGLGL